MTFFKTRFIIFLFIPYVGCTSHQKPDFDEAGVHLLLDNWHRDVALYHFDTYFDAMTDDAVFVGTDAKEVWDKTAFMKFSKPYFDKKQTWNFKSILRNIYHTDPQFAWFDETLETWMGVCRGSGVLILTANGWKIKHYVLSVAIPNENIQAVIEAKKENDLLYIAEYSK